MSHSALIGDAETAARFIPLTDYQGSGPFDCIVDAVLLLEVFPIFDSIGSTANGRDEKKVGF